MFFNSVLTNFVFVLEYTPSSNINNKDFFREKKEIKYSLGDKMPAFQEIKLMVDEPLNPLWYACTLLVPLSLTPLPDLTLLSPILSR